MFKREGLRLQIPLAKTSTLRRKIICLKIKLDKYSLKQKNMEKKHPIFSNKIIFFLNPNSETKIPILLVFVIQGTHTFPKTMPANFI